MLAERRTIEEKEKALNKIEEEVVNNIDAANELWVLEPPNLQIHFLQVPFSAKGQTSSSPPEK